MQKTRDDKEKTLEKQTKQRYETVKSMLKDMGNPRGSSQSVQALVPQTSTVNPGTTSSLNVNNSGDGVH